MLSIQDVLRPNIININGRCYRQLPIKSSNNDQQSDYTENLASYVEEDTYYDEPNTCSNQPEWQVGQTSNGYEIVIEDLPMFYYKFIIGKGGSKKKEIERSSNASIKLPPKGSQGNVIISGRHKCDVVSGRNQLQTIIDLHRTEQPATHFLCIALDADHMDEKFADFKEKVLELNARGVDGSIFQEAKRLHLTLSLTPFLNDAEVNDLLPTISDTVNQIKQQYLPEELVKIHLRGIEYMNDDPGEVDVLYAKVSLPDSSNRLQKFVDEVVDALSTNGLVKKQYDHVKLHATIMNTLFRENKTPKEERTRNQKFKERVTFDATKILELYGDYVFGEVTFNKLDISLKGSYDKDGRYKRVVSIPLLSKS